MKKKLSSIVLATLFSLSLLAGCGKSEEKTTEATTQEVTTEAVKETVTEAASPTEAEGATKDRAGNDIVIPEKVEKIISMAPSTTRFLIDLGLGDKIIAIDTNSYAYLDSLPKDVQQFDMMEPDNEALVALEPDIVFTSGMSNVGGDDAFQSVRDAGICVADIPSSTSFAEIAEDMKFIGSAVGKEAEAQKLIDEFNKKHAEVEALGKTVTEKKKILFMISLPSAEYPSIYTFGKGTFLDEMITDIGAENVTGDQESWISISEEEAIAMNPDVIVTNIDYVDDVVNVIKSAEGWGEVNAIKNDAVYYIDATSSNQPNNHTVDALIQMAKLVYPDVFAELDDPFATAGDAE